MRLQCEKLYGPGEFTSSYQPSGDMAYTYCYDPATMPTGTLPKLTDDEVRAIAHGRVALANLGNVYMQDGKWVSRVDPSEDPAIPERLVSLNTLEELLTRYDKPSVPKLALV